MRQGGPGMSKSAAYPRKFAKKIFQEHSAFRRESWIFIQWDENAVGAIHIFVLFITRTYALNNILTTSYIFLLTCWCQWYMKSWKFQKTIRRDLKYLVYITQMLAYIMLIWFFECYPALLPALRVLWRPSQRDAEDNADALALPSGPAVVEPQIQIKAVSSLVQLSSIKAVQLVQKEPLPRKMQIVIEALKLSSGMANFHSCTWNLWIWTTPEWVWKLIFVGCQYIASILASETPSYIHYYNIIIISKPNSHIAYVISALSPFGPGLVNSIGAPFSPGRLHTVGDTLDWLRSRSSCWTGWLMGHILLSSLLDWVSSTKRNRTPFEPSWGFYTCELHMCVYYIAMMPLAQGGVQWTYH